MLGPVAHRFYWLEASPKGSSLERFTMLFFLKICFALRVEKKRKKETKEDASKSHIGDVCFLVLFTMCHLYVQ